MAFSTLRTLALACTVSTLTAGSALAALIDRGGGVVYDTGTGLDWEQRPGAQWIDYPGAKNYVAGLTLDGGGWRLPSIAELSDLNAELIALTGCYDCSGSRGPFDGIPLGVWTNETYWAGHPGAMYVSFWVPATAIGIFETMEAGVWAVRAGTAIPEPASWALVAVALGVAGVGRRRVAAG